ncbi:hypothetical protein ACJ73_05613 [Blastomyces percursus]|uniref:Uncharacterized protein n=1 Tax=Blastomyces percursus TaxID=1658174 RepID=A0A1J9Q4K8_9EURO|nr:hypothetical protein ACJ73_05613 [Blastomyces percursus]
MGQQLDGVNMYKCLERGSKSHPSRKAVRMLLDSFDVHGCLLPYVLPHPPNSQPTRSSHGNREFCAGIALQHPVSLEEREITLKEQQEDREKSLCLIRKMVQWEPGKRTSAKEPVRD